MDETNNKLLRILLLVILIGSGIGIPIVIIAFFIIKRCTKKMFEKQEKDYEEECKKNEEHYRSEVAKMNEKSNLEYVSSVKKMEEEFEKKKKEQEERYNELLKRSFDMSLTPEENMQASIELGKLMNVKDNLETLEDLDNLFNK